MTIDWFALCFFLGLWLVWILFTREWDKHQESQDDEDNYDWLDEEPGRWE